MRAGDLRHRVSIQQTTQTQNDFDEWVDSWTDFVVVWAAVEPASGRLYYEAKQLSSEIEGVIRIRYRSDIEPTMRLLLDDRILKIISIVNPHERNRELLIYYKEGLD